MSQTIQSDWVNLTASDNHKLPAFIARPEETSRGNVIIVQEIFGVNHHIRSIVLNLASAGYTAIAPALFERAEKNVDLAYDEAGIASGIALKGKISWDDALKDIHSAISFFTDHQSVAVMGFCWGGTLAWLAASQLPISASICYYGGQIGEFLEKAPQVPLLAHFGQDDRSIPLRVPETLKKRYPGAISHVYQGAGHAFNCNERSSYHKGASDKAMRRTLGFLESIF